MSEQDVLKIRENLANRRLTVEELGKIPARYRPDERGGLSRTPGSLNYVSPEIDAQTGTILVRGLFKNPNRALIPGFFARIRVPLGLGAKAVLLIPNRVIAEDQAGKYVLVVNKDNVVEQQRIKTGQLLVGGLRVITEGLNADDRVVLTTNGQAVPGRQGRAQAGRPSRRRRPPPTSRRPSRRRSAPMISAFFINRPVLANVLAIVIVLLGAVALVTLPVAQYPNIVPPTVQVTTTYPGRQRQDGHRQRGAAHRAAGQRRRRHDLHAVVQHRRRHLHAHRHLRDRHQPRFRAGAGAEQGERGAGLAAGMPVQAQGVIVQKKSTSILQIVSLTSPD